MPISASASITFFRLEATSRTSRIIPTACCSFSAYSSDNKSNTIGGIEISGTASFSDKSVFIFFCYSVSGTESSSSGNENASSKFSIVLSTFCRAFFRNADKTWSHRRQIQLFPSCVRRHDSFRIGSHSLKSSFCISGNIQPANLFLTYESSKWYNNMFYYTTFASECQQS